MGVTSVRILTRITGLGSFFKKQIIILWQVLVVFVYSNSEKKTRIKLID